MKSVARGERAPRLEEPPLTDGTWRLIQDCWMQEKTTRPAIEEIVERMMQMSKLIGNNYIIYSTPAEPVSFPVQSTRLQEWPDKGGRITRMRSLASKKPYDRPEAVTPEHDLRMRSVRLASSTATPCPSRMVNDPLFSDDPEAFMREWRRKKLDQYRCPFPGCHANFTALHKLFCLSSVVIMHITLTNVEKRRSPQFS